MINKCSVCGKDNWRLSICQSCRKDRDTKKNRANNKAKNIKPWLICERGNYCQTCWEVKPLIAHHVKPLAIGGGDDEDNIILVCRMCHDQIHKEIGMKGERFVQY